MKKLNDTILKDILERRAGDEQWMHDYSNLLHQGVSQRQIGLVIDIANQLDVDPLISEDTLLDDGVSRKEIEYTLTSVENVKNLLGINYTFQNYLKDTHFDASVGKDIPYFIYQQFYREIRRDYCTNNELDHQLNVILSDSVKVSSIKLFNDYRALIPATDVEAATVTAALLADNYQCIGYEEGASLLELETLRDSRRVKLEIRCLSSKFESLNYASVCVVDDCEVCHPRDSLRKKLSFPQLMKRHMMS
ncbi:TPA: hypothetical protein NG605_004321 [Vibrio parahaemolyticus]|nr:hypothetical protein [Vibrio parahaemolyticus]